MVELTHCETFARFLNLTRAQSEANALLLLSLFLLLNLRKYFQQN
jgi:hypothetical protein